KNEGRPRQEGGPQTDLSTNRDCRRRRTAAQTRLRRLHRLRHSHRPLERHASLPDVRRVAQVVLGASDRVACAAGGVAMIGALIQGTLANDPAERTASNGNRYWTASARVPAGDDVLFVGVSTFDEKAGARLM